MFDKPTQLIKAFPFFIENNLKIVYNNYAAIAQLDRAFDYESKGCKFESC